MLKHEPTKPAESPKPEPKNTLLLTLPEGTRITYLETSPNSGLHLPYLEFAESKEELMSAFLRDMAATIENNRAARLEKERKEKEAESPFVIQQANA